MPIALSSTPVRLSLRVTTDLAHYDDACAAYAAVDRLHPQHRSQAAVEPLDDLEELRRAGTLFDVLLDDEWSGYVAAERGHRLGLDGYKIAELILTEAARGRGHGRYLTSLLARELVTGGSDLRTVIIGTIHNDNLGARHAAQRAGRLDVGGWVRSAFS
jgi:GNAT superfamily N-acetyltransferase